ncbi:hypothetical protein B296_00046958 [Ensete ventricosum]|uniref:Uncharacterized protein n=1 Tax=Ensete ventricosum TaxID=4639 RepID=A0A426Y1H6_ENSVE|nr:hypothetical protein B296_00046958 [Ensete ventricosum]
MEAARKRRSEYGRSAAKIPTKSAAASLLVLVLLLLFFAPVHRATTPSASLSTPLGKPYSPPTRSIEPSDL